VRKHVAWSACRDLSATAVRLTVHELTSASLGSTLYAGGTKSCSKVMVTLVGWLPTRLTSILSL